MDKLVTDSAAQPTTTRLPTPSPSTAPQVPTGSYVPPPSYVLLPAEPDAHPHTVPSASGRTYITKRQRGSDAITVGTLLLYLPNFLYSLLVMGILPWLFHTVGLVMLFAWLLSGALVFCRTVENVFAHRLLRMRRPTPDERARLEPAWHEVASRAGVQACGYELWVENSPGLNASVAGGHIVCVTGFALHHLPDRELAALLARELGRHVAGHSWSSLLGRWYAVPGELAWSTLRAALRKLSRILGVSATALALLAFVGFTVMTAGTLCGLPLALLATPYLLAYVHRRAELRADRHAAALGFGTALVSALERVHEDERKKAGLRAWVRPRTAAHGLLQRLLATHPEQHIRINRLVPLLHRSL